MMQPPSVELACGLAVRIRHNANRHAATAPASNGDMNFYIQGHLHKIMTALACIDYGFECDFVTQGDVEKMVEEFRVHMEEEHGIEYSAEAIMQFVMRKQGS